MSLANALFVLQSSRQSLELLQLASVQVAVLEQGERAATKGTFKIAVSLPYPSPIVRDIIRAWFTIDLTSVTGSRARVVQARQRHPEAPETRSIDDETIMTFFGERSDWSEPDL